VPAFRVAAVDTTGCGDVFHGAYAAALARGLATALGAELIALSVIEPPVPLPEVTPPLSLSEYSRRATQALERRVWPLFGEAGIKTVAAGGHVVDVIQREAAQRSVDLVVVGSHGKGWRERLLVGSTTERLLNHLPTSVLVVPVEALKPEPRAPRRRPARKRAGARSPR